jgi:hypothetical protein
VLTRPAYQAKVFCQRTWGYSITFGTLK